MAYRHSDKTTRRTATIRRVSHHTSAPKAAESDSQADTGNAAVTAEQLDDYCAKHGLVAVDAEQYRQTLDDAQQATGQWFYDS
ncbi:Uncharacterised protein [Mycobacteroides abscessus subsp. bolletii]|nr:Uncharacterised protein [Mycobacteroides abscessus subsp. bolletii]